MRLRGFAFWISAALAASPAAAVEFHHAEGPFVAVHHCTCRFDGQDVDLGQRRCLRTADGPRAAVCVMEQNVTSWRPSGESCPEASFVHPRLLNAPDRRATL